MSTFVFEIGGTNIRLGLSADGKHLDVIATYRTPKTWPAARKVIKTFLAAHPDHRLQRVIGGLPGLFDTRHTQLLVAFCLPKWQHQPILRDLTNMLHVPVRLENDCVLGALGEAVVGAGKKYDVVGYIAVGTGIGGAKIVHGRIDQHAEGFEPGHQVISGRKTVSDLVGGDSIRKRFGRSPQTIRSIAVWRGLGRELSVGLRNAVMLWSPDVLILGGSVIRNQPVFAREARRSALLQLRRFGYHVVIRQGRLGDTAGLYGALALAR